VEDRRRGAVGELRESEVELMAGSAWAEEVWNGGSTVSSSSPAFGWPVAAFWGFGAGSWRGKEGKGMQCSLGAEARERWGAGAFPRASHGGGEVAAAELDQGIVAREGGSSTSGSGARGSRGCRVWQWAVGGGLPAFLGGERRRSALAAEEAERERGGRQRLDLFAISEKFRGPTTKQK